MGVSVMVPEPDNCPALRPGGAAYPDSPEGGDGDAGDHHRQGHDHEGGGPGGQSQFSPSLRDALPRTSPLRQLCDTVAASPDGDYSCPSSPP